MLSMIQIKQIREHLERAQNPVFFFDNDSDGLCSFLILQRYLGRGRGVVIKSFPGLNKSYFKKVEELNSDYIFVLDKPAVDEEFIDLANEKNIPLVYIDHHNVPKPKNTENYYNTFYESGKIEPVSYICYKITERKEDIWLAVMGCISDCFIPEFLEDFKKENPDLIDYNYKTAFDVYYNTKFGRIIKILTFGLLDKTSNVVLMLKYLMKAKGPYDILEENAKTKSFLQRFSYVNTKYNLIINKAEKNIDLKNKILFFTYSGELSMSQPISDELIYRHPNFFIAVGYIKENRAKFSLRGSMNVREITLKALEDLDSASGGGHEHATGAQLNEVDIEKFKQNILKELEKN